MGNNNEKANKTKLENRDFVGFYVYDQPQRDNENSL